MINRADVDPPPVHVADGGKHAFRIGEIFDRRSRGVDERVALHDETQRRGRWRLLTAPCSGQQPAALVRQFRHGLRDHRVVERAGQLQAK